MSASRAIPPKPKEPRSSWWADGTREEWKARYEHEAVRMAGRTDLDVQRRGAKMAGVTMQVATKYAKP